MLVDIGCVAVEHWCGGEEGDEAVDFGRRGRGDTLQKAAQNLIDNQRRGLQLRGTTIFGLFFRDVIVAAGDHVVSKSCHDNTF